MNDYYDEYGVPKPVAADSKVVAFTEQIASWKEQKLLLYPQDIFNMLIDHSLISKEEVEEILRKTTEKKPAANLPSYHIII